MIQEAIKAVVENEDLDSQQAYQVMNSIMQGEATPAQIGAFLIAAKLKGETYLEIAGFARAMREKATRVRTKHSDAIDMCGTGGDGSGTFNVSTVASFVVAGAGVPVAKHGNRSVSSKCGSADVLEALNIKIDLDAQQMGRCLDEVGFAFLFAPTLHKAMKFAIGPRREIGIRTVFNILGPLTNPAHVERQVVGVYEPGLTSLMAKVLKELGSKHVLTVHSEDGLDEISVQASTRAVELKDGVISERQLSARDFGLNSDRQLVVAGGTPEDNARITLALLNGQDGIERDMVIANAAAGLVVGGKVTDLAEGAQMAADAIDSGAALAIVKSLEQVTNSLS